MQSENRTSPVTTMTSDPVLSVRDLRTSFHTEDGWREVVKGISFDLAPGETLAIVGESGSGKSVTSMSIMHLLPKKTTRIEGSVRLTGRELNGLDNEGLRQVRGNDIAMIFQEPMTSLNPIFTVGRQITEALTTHGTMSGDAAKAEAIRLLEKVRIPNAAARFDDYPHQFSGGMRQRVMIAMALAARPKVLIADEPTTALDVTIQGQILDLIKELQDETAMAVLFVTHDMGVVAEIADRTLVMLNGELVEAGPTSRIFNEGEHPYTRALLSAVPRLGSMSDSEGPARFHIVDATTGQPLPDRSVGNTVTDGEPVLKVEGLTTRFHIRSGFFRRTTGMVHAVEDVSFDLKPGETLSIVGESGCGKSTTGRTLIRLVEPSEGKVEVDGQDMLALAPAELRRMRRTIQMVFQDPFAALNPRMSISAALMEYYLEHKLGSRAEARDKAADLIRKVGLSPDMLKRFPHEFSGGQRQRICIARSLMLDPKVIIADESVSALDVSIKAQVCNLLLDLQESLGLSYLFISHDMAVVERVSHRVAVMYLGEIVEIGRRRDIFDNPCHPYTQKLMAAVPVPDPSRRGMRRGLKAEELKSPVRPVGYQPPKRSYREVTPGHLVMID
jgi:peptide/nickel transport system ATP-binding protein